MSRYAKYKAAKTLGVLTLSNWGGLEILKTEYTGEPILACFNFGGERQNFHFHNVHHTSSGRAFIRKLGKRYYLDQIMRVQ